jgi:hypothetical protein
MASSSFPGRVAYCSIDGATGALIEQSGDFASCTRTGAGAYSLVYQAGAGIDPAECVFLLTPRAAGAYPFIRSASDTGLLINTVDPTAIDLDCTQDLVIICKPAN